MIIGKTNLLVVGVTADDKRIPVLDNVFIAEDGSSVGSNGRVVLLVSPVKEEIIAAVPLDKEAKVPGGNVAIDSKSVKEAIRNMPRDTMFGGLLEHCSIIPEKDKSGVDIGTSDGHRKKQISGRIWPRGYIKYEEIVRLAFKENTAGRCVLNLRRLLSLLTAINKICGDTSGETPVYLELKEDGIIILRSTNRRMRQDIIGVMVAYEEAEGKWKELSDWERSLISAKTRVKGERKRKSLRPLYRKSYIVRKARRPEVRVRYGTKKIYEGTPRTRQSYKSHKTGQNL